jgi:hypothetical protein
LLRNLRRFVERRSPASAPEEPSLPQYIVGSRTNLGVVAVL